MRNGIEADNLREIDRLNQRGGRTLSFVDLIAARTLTAEMAGELTAIVEAGASILTAARQSGTGKSTVLAGLLACLPPGEKIATLADESAVDRAAAEKPKSCTCYVVNEIGQGPVFGYLWGDAAVKFIGIAGQDSPKKRIASCLHADEISEVYNVLLAQGANTGAIRSIGIVLFIARRGRGRRVSCIYVAGGESHVLHWRHDDASDTFIAEGNSTVRPDRVAEFTELYRELVSRGVREFSEVRAALAEKLSC